MRANSAAIIPRQFTGFPFAGPSLREASSRIHGFTAGGQAFFGVTDTIGNDDLRQQLGLSDSIAVQDVIMRRNEGLLILELITGMDEGVAEVTIFLPRMFFERFGCPEGTNPVGGP